MDRTPDTPGFDKNENRVTVKKNHFRIGRKKWKIRKEEMRNIIVAFYNV